MRTNQTIFGCRVEELNVPELHGKGLLVSADGVNVEVVDIDPAAKEYRPQSPELPVGWWADELPRRREWPGATDSSLREESIRRAEWQQSGSAAHPPAVWRKPETRRVSWWGWVKWWFGR
jgi:hypothetical protein